jgi:hypothetical protein
MTVRPSAVELLERYVDARELAALMGVSTSTVKRFVRAGMPSETWGMRRTRRYLPSQAMTWAQGRGKITRLPDGDRNAAGPRQSKQ